MKRQAGAELTDLQAPAEQAPDTNHGRMYSLRSKAAWEAVCRWVKTAGLKTASVDGPNQLLLTRWEKASGKGLRVADPLPTGFALTRFQIQIFVSPFVEPARVYVTSLVEGTLGDGTTRKTAIFYNVALTSERVLDDLSREFGEPGRRIPTSSAARAELARLLQPGIAPCTAAPGGAPTPPTRIAHVEPLYPATAIAESRQGVVTLQTVLQEDGTVCPLKKAESAGETDMLSALRGAVTTWRYRPAMLGGCPIPVIMTVSSKFSLQ
jgi:TonB family protein